MYFNSLSFKGGSWNQMLPNVTSCLRSQQYLWLNSQFLYSEPIIPLKIWGDVIESLKMRYSIRDKKPSLINFCSLEINADFLFHLGYTKLQVNVTLSTLNKKKKPDNPWDHDFSWVYQISEIARQPNELNTQEWQAPCKRKGH